MTPREWRVAVKVGQGGQPPCLFVVDADTSDAVLYVLRPAGQGGQMGPYTKDHLAAAQVAAVAPTLHAELLAMRDMARRLLEQPCLTPAQARQALLIVRRECDRLARLHEGGGGHPRG